MKKLKINIITSCTGEKKFSPEDQLTQEDFRELANPQAFYEKEDSLKEFRTPAEDIYTGQQHIRLMKGVKGFRDKFGKESIDLWILSAGYGLMPGEQKIVPYECTFQGMKVAEIADWSEHLNIKKTTERVFAENADLNLVLLGDSYLRALNLDEETEIASPTIFLASKGSKKLIKGKGNFRIITLSNKEAKRFSCGLVGLKGELTKRILKHLGEKSEKFKKKLLDTKDVLSLFDEKSDAPAKRKKPAVRSNPEVDQVISIPKSWWEKPHREKLQYFIPEWDDLVDPDYDFENDIHSGGRGDWSNEVYAHQMYPEPNYDGILISKVVAEKTQKKKERINEMGVHRYSRVPDEFPIMGDCGAFGYIMDEVPPYTTEEILEYYTRLGFNYGVSLDHLIVKATEDQKKFRYELTINNAEEFLMEHRKLKLDWEPIGAVQGWDPKSYAEAAQKYVAMGYKYIGIGGLVRTPTKQILQMMDEVHKVVPKTVAIHLFGLARISHLREFAELGVRSVDSASFLRRAWMGTGQNYLTDSGDLYAAIRIPEAGKSFRAKRIVSEGRATQTVVAKLERNCLKILQEFEKGLVSVEQTLDVLEEYDRLITNERDNTRPLLKKVLEDSPWRKCECPICKKDGIEVIIFRGNNRNRRRGFHNTYVFYKIIQQILNTGKTPPKWGVNKSTYHDMPLFAASSVTGN